MYKRPKTMEELLQASSLKTETILAGGTDLVPLIKNGVKNCSSLIDITQIPELKKIEKTDKGWFIGTAVTLSSLAENPDIRQAYPALSKAAGKTASPQIRSIGTIGGNILQNRRCMYFNQSAYWRRLPLPRYAVPYTILTPLRHCASMGHWLFSMKTAAGRPFLSWILSNIILPKMEPSVIKKSFWKVSCFHFRRFL